MHTEAPSPRTWAWDWDAIIVAGGRARRLGGIDKTALVWNGRSLLDGVLAAAARARRICVVGSEANLPVSVLRTVERPRWGGPAAAIVAGLETLNGAAGPGTDSDWIVVLAGDLLRPSEAVAALLHELEVVAGADDTIDARSTIADGVIGVDGAGRRQPLLAVYRRAALATAATVSGSAENLSVMSLIGALTLHELHLPESLSADVDTPADAARLGIEVPHDRADSDLGPAHDSASP
ncbi:molybdenum cofactor guanylyltransferase [Cryobacterium sp. PAMC25264]|uniref:molybdenum cofactor guanylyltransferase n=1 Tax=Cryobacterium sp. PAMC25264 TaxID=2861288 RepID=UPI001C63346B|nr:NTP transferase domain-containing protein [Cryobacterium sp. PAMC25264]QYF74256.1 NTP transferase domain-containing protein [Cryobacterium sp. PAMC25264]